MSIKDVVISASRSQNIMPGLSTKPVASGFYPPGAPRVPSMRDWLDDFAKRKADMAEYRTLMKELGEQPDADVGKILSASRDEKAGGAAKRYLVDQETGVISVDEEEGELNYRDAQIVSASIAKKRGDYDQAISLIKAVRDDPLGGGETRKKVWDVDEYGQIERDPENGEYTLSEAREVSRSRQALIPRDEPINKDKLDIMKRDIRDEFKGIISDEVGKLKTLLGTKDGELPFTFDEKGEPQLNKNSKFGLMELVIYNTLKNANKQERMYKDADGVVMDLPSWLEVKGFEREQARKDQMNDTVTGLIEMGRKELPPLVQGIINMTTTKKAEEALAKGGWSGQDKAKSETSELKTASCAGCHRPFTYTSAPLVMACPKCNALNFIGTKEEFEHITAQLSSQAKGEVDTQVDLHVEGEE